MPVTSCSATTATRPQTQDQPWDTCDLELLHHFTTCCCVKIPGEHRQQLWTREIVTLSFSHADLLNQIMAVSALHLYHHDPSRTHLVAKAVKHRDRALECVHSTLAGMKANLCIPVFAFAGLSMIFAFAEVAIRLDTEGPSYDAISHIAECLQQNVGITTVVRTYREDIESSWAGELINLNSDEDFDWLATSGLVFTHEKLLHDLIDLHEQRAEWNNACHHALNTLLRATQILMWRQQNHYTVHLINAWPSDLAPEFWQLLDSRRPIALMIMAYFAALASLRPNLWWFQRWPQILLREITARLGEEWKEALAWPTQMINDPQINRGQHD